MRLITSLLLHLACRSNNLLTEAIGHRYKNAPFEAVTSTREQNNFQSMAGQRQENREERWKKRRAPVLLEILPKVDEHSNSIKSATQLEGMQAAVQNQVQY